MTPHPKRKHSKGRRDRREYAVEDAAMLRWYAQRVTAGTWPPIGPQLDWLDE